jgi:uncharacterized membrane protein
MGDRTHPDLERFLEPERVAILRAVPGVVAGCLALATIVGMILLRPTGEDRPDLAAIGINPLVFDATVEAVETMPCPGTGEADGIPCARVSFRLDEGPDNGRVVTQEVAVSPTSPVFEPGDRVVLDYQEGAEPQFQYRYADRQRRGVLLGVAVVFALAVVALGRLKGVAALAGLAASVLVMLQFVVPAILDGRSPVLVALVGAAAIGYVALYAAHGFTRMATVALLGTLAALALTVVLSWIALALANLSGFASDESYILTLVGTIDISGLVLAGVVLGSLGAIDDVTITQASAVWELKAARPDLTPRALFSAGLRVGRDHVASMVNTLLLAYAGAAMPLLLFFVLAEQSLGSVLNSEIVATEALRTLLGSIGLVSAVPFTTWLAAITASGIGGAGYRAHGHGV